MVDPWLRVVANTTPLIALAQCDLFPLLQILFGQVLIPPAVYREVVSEGDGRAGAEETQRAVTDGWLVIAALQEPADAIRMQQAFSVTAKAKPWRWPGSSLQTWSCSMKPVRFDVPTRWGCRVIASLGVSSKPPFQRKLLTVLGADF